MTQPDTRATLAEDMAAHGRPVPPAGLARARRTLEAAAQRREPDARKAALEQLRSGLPAT
ncbi:MULTISPECIES: hypothetical protein [unclassified Actinoplanes]|uniref:hypothetical protein n=1 Tax=unclassified Actinoplanes TaxID=2626549 RepID=UPI0012BAD294|nr:MULTISPECIES: hypothetical protein [unclassified Actinoplanes]